MKRLTKRRADRALLALVELIECVDTPRLDRVRLDAAADICRRLRDGASR